MRGSVHSLCTKMRRPTCKSGNLDIKLPAKIRSRGLRGWKAWKRRWIVLHSLHDVTAGFAVVTLDVYSNSSSVQSQHQLERSTIYLEAVIHIQRVISRSHPYAFYVEARETAVYLAADCETETQEWMDVLRDVFWPRPSQDIDDDVHTVAVTDAAFCTLFGVHGGACHLCLGKDVVILRCMHTGHVLLEWPVSALARTYVDVSANAKDVGRLFIIEPRPHTSGWTTPLRLFNIRAQELVRRINERMQTRKIRKLSSAVQLPTTSAAVDEIVESREGCKSEKVRPTSFYDQPRPAKTKYMTLTTVRRQQASASYYDCPRFGFNPPEIKQPSSTRQRSHSESHLILPPLSMSNRHLARSSSSLSCRYFSSNARAPISTPIQRSTLLPPSSEKDCSCNSRDSGFQLDEQGNMASAGKLNQTVNGDNSLPHSRAEPQAQVYSEVESSKKFLIVTEPLYEELDRYRKDVSKLLGISVFHDKNSTLPPPLPPRRPRTMSFASRNESQQKDVIRFLGMEDPWAKRMVETQRTATLGIRKKNLFHFLGVDGSQTSSNTAPLIDSKPSEERTPTCQTTDDNLILYPDTAQTDEISDNSNEVAKSAYYDVPNPSSALVVCFSAYEYFAEKISKEILRCVQVELLRYGNNNSVCCHRSITNTPRINRVVIYRKLHDENRILSLILPEQLFLSILYYSWLTEFKKYISMHQNGNHFSHTSFHRQIPQLQWI